MDPEKSCQVCSKAAKGMHFGVLTCRACAAFFRRAVVLKLEYNCKVGKENCDLDGKSRLVCTQFWISANFQIFRKICRFCRLQKCREIGMNAESKPSESPESLYFQFFPEVILDYDPTVSQKNLEQAPEEKEEKLVSGLEILKMFDLFFFQPETTQASLKFASKPKLQFNLKIDFTELVLELEEIFEVSEKSEKTDLEILTDGLKAFRANQWEKEKIQVRHLNF